MRKFLRWTAIIICLLIVVAAGAGTWFYFKIRASLPVLEGELALAGLSSTVQVERDDLGVPTLNAENRLDVARALGFLHAQERFFQMDLIRRRAAGELAELVGEAAVPLDRSVRVHGFRRLSGQVVQQLPAAQQALLEAYTAGVNAGLSALPEKPFEYLVLRTEPQAWKVEDCMLVPYAMALDLESEGIAYEKTLSVLRDQLGASAVAFFAPLGSGADAALDGSNLPAAPVPDSTAIDLRRRAQSARATTVASPDERDVTGSNWLALSGAHTVSGAGMIANDMHLSLALPNTWYRVSLVWPDHRVTGVTLPGAPLVVAGSNGHIAWGFTNAYIDNADLVVIDVDSISDQLYKDSRQGGLAEIKTRREVIHVKGGDDVEFIVKDTQWGPIIGANAQNRPLALRWLMHDVSSCNVSLVELEEARDVDTALAIAHRAGIPAQNIAIADARGNIAWTVAGFIPKRIGYDGRLPVSWAFGDRRWEGVLTPSEVPVVRSPDQTRLWSGNNRMIGSTGFDRLGDGSFDEPARAAQLRDGLATIEKATPADLLAVQLDHRALFLERWQKAFLGVLTPEVVAGNKSRTELRALVEKWNGSASIDSISYFLVRSYRDQVAGLVFNSIFKNCREKDPSFNWRLLRYETPLWTLLQEKPAHLLDPDFASWDALQVQAVDLVIAQVKKSGRSLAESTWGRHNTATINHPFGRLLPGVFVSWLNIKPEPLPGDGNMPLKQGRTHGPSERFVVSPGREDEGIFHMPGGQSGHPLSPFYRAGHEDWALGKPSPFLPGKTAHTLTLAPAKE